MDSTCPDVLWSFRNVYESLFEVFNPSFLNNFFDWIAFSKFWNFNKYALGNEISMFEQILTFWCSDQYKWSFETPNDFDFEITSLQTDVGNNDKQKIS